MTSIAHAPASVPCTFSIPVHAVGHDQSAPGSNSAVHKLTLLDRQLTDCDSLEIIRTRCARLSLLPLLSGRVFRSHGNLDQLETANLLVTKDPAVWMVRDVVGEDILQKSHLLLCEVALDCPWVVVGSRSSGKRLEAFNGWSRSRSRHRDGQ